MGTQEWISKRKNYSHLNLWDKVQLSDTKNSQNYFLFQKIKSNHDFPPRTFVIRRCEIDTGQLSSYIIIGKHVPTTRYPRFVLSVVGSIVFPHRQHVGASRYSHFAIAVDNIDRARAARGRFTSELSCSLRARNAPIQLGAAAPIQFYYNGSIQTSGSPNLLAYLYTIRKQFRGTPMTPTRPRFFNYLPKTRNSPNFTVYSCPWSLLLRCNAFMRIQSQTNVL